MQQWIDVVQAEVIKASHENQKDAYERGYLGGLSMGLDTIKVNLSKEAAKSAIESEYALFEDGVKTDGSDFDRGMKDGLKRVLELYQ